MNYSDGGGAFGEAPLDIATLLPDDEDDDPDSANVAFSNLYPAVIECFVIILCG